MTDSDNRAKAVNKPWILCALVWLLQSVTVGLLLGQHQLRVIHPAGVPLLALLLSIVLLLLLSSFTVLRRLLLRQHVKRDALWFGASLVPFLLFISSFWYAHKEWSERRVPHGVPGTIAVMSGGSLMEAQAKYLYPNRMESGHLVMFYDELTAPDADLKAMETHVWELEQTMELPLRSKIHWIRGSLLGQRNVSFLGLALGSDQSLDWDQQGKLDRHELAHAVLTQYRMPTADPPMVLHEGWAEKQSGVSRNELAMIALAARDQSPDLKVADLFTHQYYHLDAGLAYSYGGAFVDYLLRVRSISQFVDFYNRCGQETFEVDFENVYGVPISEAEGLFWQDMERIARAAPALGAVTQPSDSSTGIVQSAPPSPSPPSRLLVRAPALSNAISHKDVDILTAASNYSDRVTRHADGSGQMQPTKFGDPELDRVAVALSDLKRPWTFQKILAAYESEESSERRLNLLRALAASRDPRADDNTGR
jgi:hypothetical protein